MPDVQKIRLADIDLKKSFQPRVKGLDKDHVADLKAAYEAKQDIARPVAWRMPDGSFRLAEGFHRFEGASQAGIKSLMFTVLSGTESEYRVHAACSNQGHGLKRSNADKRRSVEVLLKELPDHSDRKIAELAGVSHVFVSELRLQVSSDDTSGTKTRTGKDGKNYPVNQSQVVTVTTSNSENPTNSSNSENENAENGTTTEPPQGAPEPVEVETPSEPEPPAADEPPGLVKQMETICRELDQIKRRIEAWKELPLSYCIHFPTIVVGIERIRSDIWGGRPAYPCPYCEAKGAKPDCKACKGTQMVVKHIKESGSSAMNRYGGVA